MKHLFLISKTILLLVLFSSSAFSANELFRSIGSGNWNAAATWEISTNGGGTWVAATNAPTDTCGSITIQNPHTVTVTVSVSADQLVVNSGGILSINAAVILTVKDGPGEDLVLNPGGTVSGSGTLQSQGAGTVFNIRTSAVFTAGFKINTGKTTCYSDLSPYIAKFSGALTVDAGAILSVIAGGYGVQSVGVLTNNGKITTEDGSGTIYVSGTSFVNNDTTRGGNLIFDATTSFSGSGAVTSTNISISGTGNLSLANNAAFSPTSGFTINTGGVFNPNTRTFTLRSGTLIVNNNGTTSNSGIFQTQGTVSVILRNGSNFNSPFKVNTGTCTIYNDQAPYIANFKGTVTVDAGAVLTTLAGGYTSRSYGNVTVNGTITGNAFSVYAPNFINNGTVNPITLSFDSTTNVSGSGTYTSTYIVITLTGNILLLNDVTFSPGNNFVINNGGIFNPGSKTFTFNSGSFILDPGATVFGTGANAGTLQTQGTVNFIFRNGSTFNSGVKVNTGTLTAYNDGSPYTAIFYGVITVDAGATLNVLTGGYTAQANNSVLNNGTITGSGGASFRMKGPVCTNNGSITVPNFIFDSTTTYAGTGSITSSTITITGIGNVSLANNHSFSPTSSMSVNNGGILNPNTFTLTFNSGTFVLNSGGTVFNSGLFQTQGTVNVIVKSNSNFNSNFRVNSGTTVSNDDGSPYTAVYKGTVTVNAGASLITPNGGYYIQCNNTVTNNGTINTQGGAYFRMRGASLVNNGIITGTYLHFDSTTALSGTGTYTSSYITVNGTGNVSLSSNVGFTPGSLCELKTGAVFSPNGFVFTFGSGSFYLYSGATSLNSGTFRTQNNISLIPKNGSSFNTPLNINSGITYVYDNDGPYTGTLNGPVVIDAGAVLSSANGGYTVAVNGNLTNNGTITSSGSPAFRMYGTTLTNNGTISFPNFYFETGSHNLLGTGSFTVHAVIQNGSTVTLTSNHQMQSLTVNLGGTFNVSTFKLSLKASDPIGNFGTFNASAGTLEYNGISTQTISTNGITFNKLRINNSAGTTLPSAITVNDTLSLILGDLNLNGQILTIATTGYLSETAGNTVYGTSGYITTTRSLNAPSALNVGGLGAVLTTAVNLGSTEIRRGHSVQSGLGGNTSILRYYDITPTTNTGLNATMVFKYDESELNGKPEGGLSLFRSTNSGTSWTSMGGSVNIISNQITLNSISAFSRWSASSTSAVASQITLIMEGFYNSGTGQMNMSDTVRAYLRNTTIPYAIVDSAKALVNLATYTGNFTFPNAGTGTYYIHLKHRNSIETWSKSGGQSYILGSPLVYNFTTAFSQAYGNNMVKVNTTPLRIAIYGGDIDQDGTVDASDLSLVENASAASLSGYVREDVTGDDYVDGSDVSLVENNSSASVSANTP